MNKKSGRYPWKSERDHQISIGRFNNAVERIYRTHPDTKDDLVELIELYGNLHDSVVDRSDYEEDEPSSSDIMIDRLP